MNSKNRLPWIVAAVSMLFAMIVLVRNEIVPGNNSGYEQTQTVQPVLRGPEPSWRPTSAKMPRETPESSDYSPWSQQNPPPHPTPVATPTPTPRPTPAATPTPSPTPKLDMTFRGVVLDGDKPVAEALVRVVSGKQNPAERSAITGEDGRFSITGIPDNLLDKVIVEARGYSVTMLENIPLPLPDELQIGMSALAGIDAMIMDISSSSTEPVAFDGEMQASLMELRRAGAETSEPLGISEPVLPVDSYVPVRDQHVVVKDGQLRFDNVEPGQYRVSVKSGNKVAESEVLSVRDGSRTTTSLLLGMKHTVRGNVVGEDTGKAIAQARVSLSPYHGDLGGPEFPSYMSFTDGEGEFVIPEVQPGHYWMLVGAAGYTTRTLEGFTVLPAKAPDDTSVTLIKQEPLITVSVTAADGRPLAQAPLVLMTQGAESPRTYFGKTDEAGLFRFEHLLAGRYSLSITAPGERTRQKTLNIELGDGEVRELPVSFGTPVNVSGKARVGGKAYKGVLTFLSRGAAVADSLVNTKDDGSFSTELEPGDYLVGTPEKPGRVSLTIKPTEAQTITVDIP